MKKSTRIVLIILCILLIAVSGCGIAFALMNSRLVSADFLDLSETNSIVNFNQIFKNSSSSSLTVSGITRTTTEYTYSITGTATANDYIWADVVSLDSSHKYYFNCYNDTISFRVQNFNNNITSPFIYTGQSYMTYAINFISGITYDITIKPILIDLTLMFGSGNEPNLQQAQEYFTADYYSYNTGTAMPFSKSYLQGYQDAATDIYESMQVIYNAYTIGTNSFSFNNNSIQIGTFAFDNVYSAYTFTGVLGINLIAEVQAGTKFNIDFEFYIPDMQGESSSYATTFKLYFAYVDEDLNLITFKTITPTYLGGWVCSYIGEFVLPTTTRVLYIYHDYAAVGSNEGTTQLVVQKSEMTFTTTDMGLLMANAYQRGASDTNALYAYGTDRYNSIYQLGYNNGLAEQNATLGAMEYIGAAFSGIGEVLQIELLPGVPFSLFVLLPLMFGLIAFVVKLSKGGS